MSREFYKYIATRIIGYFEQECGNLHDGDRFCLKLDNKELVQKVDYALRDITKEKDIQGSFEYMDKYRTFTIKLSGREVIVSSQIDGMTDDFFATLRNIPLSINRNPILMISSSPIDTITSATRDLGARGMPFHADNLIATIEDSIEEASLSQFDATLLQHELKRKKQDRFADKKSLYEYKSLLSAICVGKVETEDWIDFHLLPDDLSGIAEPQKQDIRIDENHRDFEFIEHVFRFGNLRDGLDSEYDDAFIRELESKKRKGENWYTDLDYARVLQSKAKKDRKQNNPLSISNEGIIAYHNSPLEYSFPQDEKFFIRNGGETKAKQREKHIVIYNPDKLDHIDIQISCNIVIKKDMIDLKDDCLSYSMLSSKEVLLQVSTNSCVFAQADVKDLENNVTYRFRICVLDITPSYLEDIQTCYKIEGSGQKRKLLAEGVKGQFLINPISKQIVEDIVIEQGQYSCNFDTTLRLIITEDSISPDNGKVSFVLSCGTVQIPMSISDDNAKPTELSGIRAFKRKNELKRGFEYRESKIIMGTNPYFAKGAFADDLLKEEFILGHNATHVVKTSNGYESVNLILPEVVADAYSDFIAIFKARRQLPSLAYYDDVVVAAAEKYVAAYIGFYANVASGQILSKAHNDTLKLGTVYDKLNNTISFSPVHPMNVLYQLQLLNEKGVGSVRDDVVERLTSLNLLPYIKDDIHRTLYEVVEQKNSPEWRYYAPIDNKRFNGARDFVPKLVSEKIEEYYAHFKFLFKGLGENLLILSLHNLGDCKEILLGIIRYYRKQLVEEVLPEDMLNFEVNIYCAKDENTLYNDFSIISNLKKVKEYVSSFDSKYEGNADLASLLVSKVKYYIHKASEREYRYSHIAFYEMLSSEDNGDSQISGLTTGASLDGLISGVPSVLNEGWYKTGFGTKYATESRLIQLATLLNSIYRIAFSSSTYTPDQCITTEVSKGASQQLDKVYSAANWIVFVDPKVDLSFFYQDESSKDLLIIHYGDQNTSASGYNAITVTRKSKQYENIISQELLKKNVHTDAKSARQIIDFFNAVNGRWLLRLISSKRALESTFSREKMSIISAIKFVMAYYAHEEIVWVPISLEELLRVSGNTGLSQNEGLLSAKNLGFDQGATCDDLLMIGIEKSPSGLIVHLHPVEVKVGQNSSAVLEKAKQQATNTHKGLLEALWPDSEERDSIERKVVRNFIMQLAILSCEKMNLYGIYPEETWELVLKEYRKDLLNENYQISECINDYIGIGTVISFKQDEAIISGNIDDESRISTIHLPEKHGYEYLVKSVANVENEIEQNMRYLPPKLSHFYTFEFNTAKENYDMQTSAYKDALKEITVQEEITEEVTTGRVDEATNEELFPVVNEPSSDNIAVTEEKEISILFGQDQSNGQPLYWHPGNTDEVFHTNTGIIGTMGTGKTQFTQSVVTQLYRERINNVGEPNIGILIFDYKGDYNESKENFVNATNARVLKPYHLPYNPLALTPPRVFKPLLPTHVANAFKDTLSRVYHLGPKQSNSLLTCIKDAYTAKGILSGKPDTWTLAPPTFQDVYNLYMNNDDIKKNDSLEAILSKLDDFEVFESDSSKTQSLFDLLSGVVVIDLSGYDSDIQNLIIAITLDLFYSQMQAIGSSKLSGKQRQLTKIILVDEADNFLHEGFPSLKKILKEGREFGIGTILSTQFLKHFGSGEDDFSKYILTWVVHNVADLKNTDIRFVFNTESNSTLENKLFNDVKKLNKHYSIVKIGNNPSPIYLKDKAFWELYKENEEQYADKDDTV